jgi:hypothetical protein
MSSIRMRERIMKDVGMKMLEEGKVLTKHEYDRCPGTPIRTGLILKQFGGWPRMVKLMEQTMPDLFIQIAAAAPKYVDVDLGTNDPLEALANMRVSKTA